MKGVLIGLFLAGLGVLASAQAQSFMGFHLLDLDGRPVKWSVLDNRRATVTYAYVTKKVGFADARNCESLQPFDSLLESSRIDRSAFRAEVRAAFDMWESIAEIDFREASDTATAKILIGAQYRPEGYAFADVKYRSGDSEIREIERSLICLNPTRTWKIGFDGNLKIYDVRYTMAHEIGHAIGLDHPGPTGQLMSHRYQETFRSLQTGDINGAIKIYGARSTKTSGIMETR